MSAQMGDCTTTRCGGQSAALVLFPEREGRRPSARYCAECAAGLQSTPGPEVIWDGEDGPRMATVIELRPS